MAHTDRPGPGARFKRPLTDAELAKVLAPLARPRGAKPPAEALIALWDIILADAEGTTYAAAHAAKLNLRPNHYAIPATQAAEITDAMMQGRTPRVRASVRIAWLDQGPATYDDPAADDPAADDPAADDPAADEPAADDLDGTTSSATDVERTSPET
jgi:hypothetical protein